MSQNNDGSISAIRCRCGLLAPIVTSWKDENLGRRFYGCQNYQNEGYCKFLRWIDIPLCDRSRIIIRGLLRKMNVLREEKQNLILVNQKLEEINQILQIEIDRLEEENKMLQAKANGTGPREPGEPLIVGLHKKDSNVSKQNCKVLRGPLKVLMAACLVMWVWSMFCRWLGASNMGLKMIN